MSKRYLAAGVSALMLALAAPAPSMAQTSTVAMMPYSVAAVQRALNDLGYCAGPVDGTMDQQTAAAIRAYEEDAGITVTGKASADLLASLESADARNVSVADIREIERRLNRRGYSIGVPDGVVDARTTAAIKSCQADAGLVVTGRPSLALLDHLRSLSTVSQNYDPAGATVQQLIEAFRQAVEQGTSN